MNLPSTANLTAYLPHVFDQGDWDSCEGNATATYIEILANRGGQPINVSRMFEYTNTRLYSYTPGSLPDNGALLSKAFQAANEYGVVSETTWAYSVANLSTVPTDAAYAEAGKLKILSYASVGTHTEQALQQWKLTIAQGYPVLVGLNITTQIATIQPGQIYKGLTDQNAIVVGGHALVLDAYDEVTKEFDAINSYGAKWNGDGHLKISYAVAMHDINEAYVATQLSGMNIQPLFTPDHIGARVYLDPAEKYIVSNDYENVYGGGNHNIVSIKDGYGATLDGNIQYLSIPKSLHDLDLLQTGNELNVYWNGGLLTSWAINSQDDVLMTDTGNVSIHLIGSGEMYVNNVLINNVTPTHI